VTRTVHVVTPFRRTENLYALVEHLEPLGVIWHPITDNHALRLKLDWVQPLDVGTVRDGYLGFSDKINRFASSDYVVDGDCYGILNDDDFYGPGVIEAIKAMGDPVVVVSMLRGQHTPPTGFGHPTFELIAARKNMRSGWCGVEQYFVTGEVFRRFRFSDDIDADGRIAAWLASEYPVIRFEPELHVWFNYLEPGRWDKVTHGSNSNLDNVAARSIAQPA